MSLPDNFNRGFYTHDNTALYRTRYYKLNLGHFAHAQRPLATSWPVIGNIATRLEMKVQEAGGTAGEGDLRQLFRVVEIVAKPHAKILI